MRKGKYTFGVYNFGVIHSHTVTVYILSETEKKYKIRIPCAIGRHAPGDTMEVLKKSVKLIDENPKADAPKKRDYDYSNAYWNR